MNFKWGYLLLLFFSFYNNKIQSQKRSGIFSNAEFSFNSEDYNSALPLYIKLLKSDSTNCNLNYKVGVCLYSIPFKRKEALPYIQLSVKNITKKYHEGSIAETKAPVEALLYYGEILQINGSLSEAKDVYIQYRNFVNIKDIDIINYVNQKIKSCDVAEEMFKRAIKIEATQMPAPLSSEYADYRAVFNFDESFVVFMSDRKGRPGIYSSQLEGNKWSIPIEISNDLDIDIKYDRFLICSLSADAKRLYVLISDEFDTKLYVSVYNGKHWGKCQKLNKNINSRFLQTHACESPDGKQLFFTSNRSGGFGNFDIYVSKLDSKHQWGPAVNIGKTINTPFNEETPFISPDNQYIYFGSEGHYNMGGYDIFVSHRISENEWSEPQNIGYPVNSTDDDLFFVPSKKTDKAYYTLKSDKLPQISLLDFGSTPELKLFTLRGSLSFSDDSHFYDLAKIAITGISGDSINLLKPDSNGEYFTQVRSGTFNVNFSAPGYNEVKESVYIPDSSKINNYIVDGKLQPVSIKKGEYITIRSILFDYNSYEIDQEESALLEQLIKIMNEYPELNLEIEGHTDSKGYSGYNRKLSLQRAKSVADYIITKGIDPNRFITQGFGDVFSIARNTNSDGSDNPEGRHFNRRAEIRILNPGTVQVINEDMLIPENLKIRDNYRYYICLLESNSRVKNSNWPHEIDTTQITVSDIDSHYLYRYGEPAPKLEALTSLKKVNSAIPEAFILPEKYFMNFSQKPQFSKNEKYTIQLAALKRMINISNFPNLGQIEIHEGKDGLNRYSWGIFNSIGEADSKLISIKEKGYKDAFVVPVSKFNDTKQKFPNKYTIQLAALNKIIDVSNFQNLDNIVLHRGNDGFNRYSWGSFGSYSEADSELKNVIEKGYSDAFVVPVSKYSN